MLRGGHMKNKKLTAALITAAMIMSVSACSKTTDESKTPEQEPTETTAEATTEASEETSGADESEPSEEETAASTTTAPAFKYVGMTPEEICAQLTLEEKAAQMMQPTCYNVNGNEMQSLCYGSILSKYNDVPQPTADEWREFVDGYQTAALNSETGIPFIYGQDSVHGVNFASDCVIFPHNINIGAANDIEKTRLMGSMVGSDIVYTHMLLNFSPCVAAAQDPRWGRTYESYSSDPALVDKLSVAYVEGMLDEGVVVCAKHFLCDGYTVYGTGEKSDVDRIIDRGDAQISEDVINENLKIFKDLVDSGVQVIMIAHNSLNGVKMHENGEYISKIKDEMGFEGFILSDWDSMEKCSGATLKDNVILSVNAGIDMFMEDANYKECYESIIEAVNEGSISMDRIDDAVTRIIKVKMDAGLFTDPYLNNFKTTYEYNSPESKDLARSLAAESYVPLKADGGLTIPEGSKIFIAGPAANDTGVMLGGWTYTWQGITDAELYFKAAPQATTVLSAFKNSDKYEVVTDESKIGECDYVLLCVGEIPYAEWNGDTEDLSITGTCGLDGNEEAIELAKESGLPTITLLFAGRNVIIEDYISDWDSVIMCYLPGTEGGAAAYDVLSGDVAYNGKLAMPYYKSVKDLEAGKEWLSIGFTAAPSESAADSGETADEDAA